MREYTTQIAIIGGGICGLWLLNVLRLKGFDAWLFEKDSLGGTQTMSSQGMIHGGLKYALGGFTTPSSESIATMPGTWRCCLAGEGQIDLSDLEVLSDRYYLFSDNKLSSRVTAFFASKSLQGQISELAKPDHPAVFRSNEFKGSLYQLQDLVINTPQLIETLSARYHNFIFQGEPEVIDDHGRVTGLQFPNQKIVADLYIFAAGIGNEKLISSLQHTSLQMQQRPLHQVMLKGDLPRIYAHAVSLKSVNKPRVTFTSHPSVDNKMVWYLGGNLAEQGVGKTAGQLIDIARRELTHLLPWIDLDHVEWATHNVSRAEPAQALANKPDYPFVGTIENAMVCWPTKLTLTPMLGDEVMRQVVITPNHRQNSVPQLPSVPRAKSPWEIAFD